MGFKILRVIGRQPTPQDFDGVGAVQELGDVVTESPVPVCIRVVCAVLYALPM